MNGTDKNERPVLIYDEDCQICRKAAYWVKWNLKGNVLEMLPCQDEAVRNRFPQIEKSVCMKAMQLILPDGKVLSGEKALPEVVKRLRGYHWAAALFKLPGSGTLTHALYRWFADRRYRIAKVLFSEKSENKILN